MKSCVVVEVRDTAVIRTRSGPRGANQTLILTALTELLAQRKTRWALSEEGEWPGGVPFDEAVDALMNKLAGVDQHHRKIRTEEALEALVRLGYLSFDNDLLSLAATEAKRGGRP